mmetsp:Transcript_145776/g.353932  ORF Transcript_145776/g.353932 Transcript_145776/m.353932 type:complete len:272 (+) Transcript_145776:409-1224(+)
MLEHKLALSRCVVAPLNRPGRGVHRLVRNLNVAVAAILAHDRDFDAPSALSDRVRRPLKLELTRSIVIDDSHLRVRELAETHRSLVGVLSTGQAQSAEEGLVGLEFVVVNDGNGNPLHVIARVENKRASSVLVVGGSSGRSAARLVADGNRRTQVATPSHDEVDSPTVLNAGIRRRRERQDSNGPVACLLGLTVLGFLRRHTARGALLHSLAQRHDRRPLHVNATLAREATRGLHAVGGDRGALVGHDLVGGQLGERLLVHGLEGPAVGVV